MSWYVKSRPHEKTKHYFIDTVCFIIHLVWMIVFFREGIELLAGLNAISCVIYLFLYYTISRGDIVKTIFIAYLEVIIHSIMALLCLGFRGGFDLYILIFIPVMFFSSCVQSQGRVLFTAGGVMAGIVYVALKLHMLFVEPIYTFSRVSVEVSITVFNVLMCIFCLIVLSYLQCSEVNQAKYELEEKNRKLTFMSSHDPMTKLMNRRSMEEVINRIDKEHCAEKHNAIAFFDIDNFKRFNDDYGHECGDIVLMKVAEIISEGIGSNDVIKQKNNFGCRWGGEEMIVLFHDCKANQVVNLITRIKDTIEAYRLPYGECELKVAVTCGIACDSGEIRISELINRADAYMLDGKKKGKNCIITDPLDR